MSLSFHSGMRSMHRQLDELRETPPARIKLVVHSKETDNDYDGPPVAYSLPYDGVKIRKLPPADFKR